MATITYTFPNQVVAAGTVGFEFKASSDDIDSDDSISVSEKYFSEELSVNNETEFFGGEIQSSFIDITIENDIDLLFTNDILGTLADSGGIVTLRLTLNGNTIFVGLVEPSTIESKTFNATNSGIADRQCSVSFRCVWVIGALKQISGSELADELLSDPNYYIPITADDQNDGFSQTAMKIVPLRKVMDACINLLNDALDYTVALNSELVDYVFTSKDASVEFVSGNLNATTDFIYPQNNKYGAIDNATFDNLCVQLTNSQNYVYTYFREDDEHYIETAYDFFVGIIRSFNFYPYFSYSGTTINIDLRRRTSGEEVGLGDVLEHSEIPFSELARSEINVTSAITGRAYENDLTKNGGSQFNYRSLFDFGEDSDLPGGGYSDSSVNSKYSLMLPGGTFVYLVRTALIPSGNTAIANPNFDTDLTGWTTVSGTWTHSNEEIGRPGYNGASVRCDIPSGTSTSEIRTTFSSGIVNDYVIVTCWAYLDYTATVNQFERVTFYINFYRNGNKIAVPEPETDRTDGKILFVNEGSVAGASYLGGGAFAAGLGVLLYRTYRLPRKQFPYRFDGVGFEVKATTLSDAAYLYVGCVQTGINRIGNPELIGTTVEDYFSSGLSRIKYRVDGIPFNIKISDYIPYGGFNYYIKKMLYNLKKNETEIEAINYPY